MLDSSPPLYAQIAARLRAQIQAGQYAAGSRIPSEHELSTRFGVGRPTVRQATQVLVSERILERRRGSGTFVHRPPREVDLFSAGGTLASFARSGLSLSTRVLRRPRLASAPPGAPPRLRQQPSPFIARLAVLEEEPVLLEEMYFDPEVFPGLDTLEVSGRSLSELARERYLLKALSVDQRFASVRLDRERARSLELPLGSVVLKVERTIGFRGASQAVFAELFCRTERVAFSQRLLLDSAADPGALLPVYSDSMREE